MTRHTHEGAVANIRLATGDYIVEVKANGADADTELDVLSLLTSAPDMLDALKWAERALIHTGTRRDERVMVAIDAAIAKAEQ